MTDPLYNGALNQSINTALLAAMKRKDTEKTQLFCRIVLCVDEKVKCAALAAGGEYYAWIKDKPVCGGVRSFFRHHDAATGKIVIRSGSAQ